MLASTLWWLGPERLGAGGAPVELVGAAERVTWLAAASMESDISTVFQIAVVRTRVPSKLTQTGEPDPHSEMGHNSCSGLTLDYGKNHVGVLPEAGGTAYSP